MPNGKKNNERNSPVPYSWCHARGCLHEIRHDKLFCVEHWRQLPYPMQLSLVDFYTVGQDTGDAKALPRWYEIVTCVTNHLSFMEKQCARQKS